MSTTSTAHAMGTAQDEGAIEISPGIVVVDLTRVDLDVLTVADLRDAMNESVAQENEEAMHDEDRLGGLDIYPA